jgi:hypothetical protein
VAGGVFLGLNNRGWLPSVVFVLGSGAFFILTTAIGFLGSSPVDPLPGSSVEQKPISSPVFPGLFVGPSIPCLIGERWRVHARRPARRFRGGGQPERVPSYAPVSRPPARGKNGSGWRFFSFSFFFCGLAFFIFSWDGVFLSFSFFSFVALSSWPAEFASPTIEVLRRVGPNLEKKKQPSDVVQRGHAFSEAERRSSGDVSRFLVSPLVLSFFSQSVISRRCLGGETMYLCQVLFRHAAGER